MVFDALLELKTPEVTTVVRWALRIVLVLFLTWLVRRKPERDDDEEGEEEEDEAYQSKGNGIRSRQPRGSSGTTRLPPRRDPYAPGGGMRQRRDPYATPGSGYSPGGGGSNDIDAIISKVSKPKTMWEVHKDGATPIVMKKPSQENLVGQTPSTRTPMQLKSASTKEKDASRRGKEVMLHGHMRPVTWITLNRDCNLIFTCSKDKKVCVWSFPEGEALGSYEGHNGAVWACSVTADSRWLVSCGADNYVIVWEARESVQLAKFELPGVTKFVEWAAQGGVNGSADTHRFVTCHNKFGSHPTALKIMSFNGTEITELAKITDLPTPASQVRWGAGDETLVSSHDTGELIFWMAETGAKIRSLQAHDLAITKFDFSSDLELVATASKDKKLKIWDLHTGEEGTLLFETETDRPLSCVAIGALTREQAKAAPDSRPSGFVICAAGGQDIRDVALSKGSSDEFETLLMALGDGAESPAGLQADGTVRGHFGPIHTLVVTGDGTALASGSEDGCVRIHHQLDVMQTPAPVSKEV